MAKPPGRDEAQRLAENLVKVLNQSEPAMFAIFAAALLEAQTVEVLGTGIPGIEREHEISHATRVNILKRMGIVTDHVANALTAFASIRNAFAHEPFSCSFKTQKVIARSHSLKKALVDETGEKDLASYALIHKHVESVTARLGGTQKWDNDVARTMIVGFFLLSYYLTFAKPRAPIPKPALSIHEIWKHKIE